jgi:hypothetical protein
MADFLKQMPYEPDTINFFNPNKSNQSNKPAMYNPMHSQEQMAQPKTVNYLQPQTGQSGLSWFSFAL